jgi:hypothetical protein
MAVILPTWFKQRQGKAEPAGDNTYRLSGPNLREGYITIGRAENGAWQAGLRFQAEGPDADATQPVLPNEYEAWEAAFELFRLAVVV